MRGYKNITPEAYLEIRKTLRSQLRAVEKEVKKFNIPSKDLLRKATSKDVVEGAVFYYPCKKYDEDREEECPTCHEECDSFHVGGFWSIVEKVLYASDGFKAYEGNDGCRYGLDGAYVRNG